MEQLRARWRSRWRRLRQVSSPAIAVAETEFRSFHVRKTAAREEPTVGQSSEQNGPMPQISTREIDFLLTRQERHRPGTTKTDKKVA